MTLNYCKLHDALSHQDERTKKPSQIPCWSTAALFCYIWSPSHKSKWGQDLPFSTSWWLVHREMTEGEVEGGADKGHRCTLKNLRFIDHTYTARNNGSSLGKKTACKVTAKNVRDHNKYSTVVCARCNYFLPLISQCSTNNFYDPVQSCFLIKGWLCLLAANTRDAEKHQ